jgi:hypothetical protein
MSIGSTEQARDPELGMAAAALRADGPEITTLLHALVATLEGTPGLELVVDYRGGWLTKVFGDLPYLRPRSGPIKKINLSVGANLFAITVGPELHCHTGQRSVTGQWSHRRQVSITDWSRDLSVVLDQRATGTAALRQTLDQLIAI